MTDLSGGLGSRPAQERAVPTEGHGAAVLADYVCIICERKQDARWARHWKGRDRPRPPCCAHCERDYGRPAKDGAFGDRRTVGVGSALAEALACEAYRATWPEAWR